LLAGEYFVGAILLDLASGAFVLQTGLAIYYPPAGLYLAAVLLLGWAALPLAFLSPVFSVLVALHIPDMPLAATLGIGVVSMVAPALALALSKKIFPQGIRLDTLRNVLFYAALVLFAETVECLAAAAIYIWTGLSASEMFITVAMGWWISNAIPFVTLTPLILLWYYDWPDRRFATGNRVLFIHAILILICVPVALLAAFHTPDNISAARLYIVLLPILWAALVGGITGSAWISFVIAASVLILAPVLMIAPGVVLEAQFFLMVATLTGLIAGAIVTEQRQADVALRESERKYRAIVDNAIDGIFQTTFAGRFIKVNPALARIFGYATPEEMINTVNDISTQLYVDPDKRVEFRERLAREKHVIGFEHQAYRKDGTVIWVAINAYIVHARAGWDTAILRRHGRRCHRAQARG
jgi:PAS domain S-box-containing protein